MQIEQQTPDGDQVAAIEETWRKMLRRLRSAVTPAVEADASEVRRTENPKRVLIVEDDIDSVRTLAALVGSMGHEVEYAINGYVALDLVRRFAPDVVLLDLGLPGLDGFDVCGRIKADAASKHVRVIVITGYSQPEFRARSLMAGCETHLVKPVSPSLLEELLG